MSREPELFRELKQLLLKIDNNSEGEMSSSAAVERLRNMGFQYTEEGLSAAIAMASKFKEDLIEVKRDARDKGEPTKHGPVTGEGSYIDGGQMRPTGPTVSGVWMGVGKRNAQRGAAPRPVERAMEAREERGK